MKSTSIFIVSALVLGITLFSCSIEKRLYSKGYSVEWNRGLKLDSQNKEALSPEISNVENDLAAIESDIVLETEPALTIETNEAPPCDSIKLKSGEIKLAVVQEIGVSEIKYKNCDESGPLYVVEKSSVKSIRYASGKEEEIITPKPEVKSEPRQDTRVLEGFGLAGFIFSILGLFVAGIPLGILAMIFGIVGIGRNVNHPSKFKGAAFGIIALILGLVVLIATIALVV